MKKQLVKQNINFLEYPLWFQDERLADNSPNGMTWLDREGYIYRCGYKPPVKIDGIFLIYLLLQSQKNEYPGKIVSTRYEVLKGCGRGLSKAWYKRLEESLNRWLRVDIAFEGKFYNGIEYSNMAFHIIDSWEIEKKSKKLIVTFSPKFIEMMKGKGFFKYINFTEFKQLDSPLATRLYEILSKTFHGRSVWEIDAVKFAEKIPLAQKFPSDIIRKLKPAVNRINKRTELKIDLSVRQKERGKAILIFRKFAAESRSKGADIQQPTFETLLNDEFSIILDTLPKGKREQKTIINILQTAYNKHGADYVIRNIKYANRKAKKNYRPFLIKSLKEDWGITVLEDELESVVKMNEEAKKKRETILEEKMAQVKRKTEENSKLKAEEYINSLSSEARQQLEQEALNIIAERDPEVANILKSSKSVAQKIAANLALKTTMTRLVLQRLNFR